MKTAAIPEVIVADIMQQDVVTATSLMTVRELVQLLADEAISGVPVLSSTGTIEGVVSTTDVVRMAAYEREIPAGSLRWVRDPGSQESMDEEDDLAEDADEWGDDQSSYYFASGAPAWFTAATGPASAAALDEMTVADIMTPVAFTIEPSESLTDLMRFFLRGRIHRALVVANGRLLGIVTPFDVMRGILEGPKETS